MPFDVQFLFQDTIYRYAIRHGFGVQMAAVFWNKIEELLAPQNRETKSTNFRTPEVVTINMSFQRVPLVEFSSIFRVAPQED